jgi:hypothetical protein
MAQSSVWCYALPEPVLSFTRVCCATARWAAEAEKLQRIEEEANEK